MATVGSSGDAGKFLPGVPGISSAGRFLTSQSSDALVTPYPLCHTPPRATINIRRQHCTGNIKPDAGLTNCFNVYPVTRCYIQIYPGDLRWLPAASLRLHAVPCSVLADRLCHIPLRIAAIARRPSRCNSSYETAPGSKRRFIRAR